MLLIKFDLEKNEFVNLKDFSGEGNLEIANIIYVKGNIYLIPRYGKFIYSYHLDDDLLKKIKLESLDTDQELFDEAFLFENKIFCVTAQQRMLIVLNCEDNDILKEIDYGIEMMKQGINCNRSAPSILYEHFIIVNLYDGMGLFLYDLNDGKVIIKKLDAPRKGVYSSMAQINHYIFMYDKINKIIDKYDFYTFKCADSYELGKKMDYRIMGTGEELLIDSLFSGEVIALNEEFEVLQRCGERMNSEAGNELQVGFISQKKEFYYNTSSNKLFRVKELNVPITEFIINDNWACKNKHLIANTAIMEEKKYRLEQFIHEI